MAVKIGGNAKVTGVADVLRALRLCQTEVKTRVRADVETTTKEVSADAKRRVSISTPKSRKAKGRAGPGELRDTIRPEMSASPDAFIGYVKAGHGKLPRRSHAKKPKKLGPLTAKAFAREQERLAARAIRELGMYAMVQEFGAPHRGQPANPYLRPSADAARPKHHERLRKSLQASVQRASQG